MKKADVIAEKSLFSILSFGVPTYFSASKTYSLVVLLSDS